MTTKLQWGRILLGGFLVEVVLIVLFIPLLGVAEFQTLLPYVLVGVFLIGFAVSWWLSKKVQGRHLLHGTLMGVFATVLYLLLCMAQPEGGLSAVVAMYGAPLFVIANLLRIVGCAAGAHTARPR